MTPLNSEKKLTVAFIKKNNKWHAVVSDGKDTVEVKITDKTFLDFRPVALRHFMTPDVKIPGVACYPREEV